MIKRNERETAALQEIKKSIRTLLAVDFSGEELDSRVRAMTASIVITLDNCGYHIDEPKQANREGWEMKRYTYQAIEGDRLISPEQLNEIFGEDGWQLVGIVPQENKVIFYFMKEG